MFSNDDVRGLIQSFPPNSGHHGMPPALLLASSGRGLITLDQVRADYAQRVTTETKRIPLADLARDLDVSPEVVLTLIPKEFELAFLSKDGTEVIPKTEHDRIYEKLQRLLHRGIFLRHEFESEHDVDFTTLKPTLRWFDHAVAYHDDLICTPAYEKEISQKALDNIDRAINNTTNIDLRSNDLQELPGSPPKWFFLRQLQRLAESPEYIDKVILRDAPEYIRVQAKDMKAHIVDSWSHRLSSGDLAYVDLQALMVGNVTHDSLEDIIRDFESLKACEVVESFAISLTWFTKFIDQKLRALHHDEADVVDVAQNLSEKLQTTENGHRRFPESLYGHIQRKAEQILVAVLQYETFPDCHRFGTVVLTSEQYAAEQNNMADLAKEDATAQWQQLKDVPDYDIKFNLSNITQANPSKTFIYTSLAKEKPIQKALEESFSATFATLESDNETAFSTFWLDRVSSRISLYTTGLTSISDQRLHAQLSSLLATYIQTDLVPDTLAKARTQHLVLSRKTKKNIAKLESTISGLKSNDDLQIITSSLEKFTSKQSLPTPTPALLTQYKDSMIQDMIRRSTKSSKPNDPLLFLTLIVVLHAKYHDGVVYATGKYAPKILKGLNGTVGEEVYAVLEGWKEDVRTGKLGVEGREGIRVMMSEGKHETAGEEIAIKEKAEEKESEQDKGEEESGE